MTLKPLNQQTILITGASSGIGLMTARMAAEAGAHVVLVARNEGMLKQVVDEIKAAGGHAAYAVADVADKEQLRSAADTAVSTFGGIDTWVNNAGVGMFARITESKDEDEKRLFETNFWGLVNGSKLAVQYLTKGGALINVGSEVSDVAIPVQGMYAASKHAVLGFTDALRTEILEAGLPISVTTIKPAGIDTPFAMHAKNIYDKEPTLPAPVYAPELVAEQILHAATHEVRELYVGGGGRLMALFNQHFPQLSDWFLSKMMPGQQQTNRPADHTNEGLHSTQGGHGERGGISRDHAVREHSAHDVASRNPWLISLILTAGAAIVAYLYVKKSNPDAVEKAKQALRDNFIDPGTKVVEEVKHRLSDML